MILRHRAALGGVQLDEVDERILVLGVASSAAKESEVTANREGNGQRYIRTKRESAEITVKVGLLIKKDDMEAREELMEQVVAWANSVPAWLTISQKPDRRIWVESVRLPAAGDPYEWTNEFTFTFKAMGVPYWQQKNASSAKISGSDASGSIEIGGNTETVANAEAQNISGMTINNIIVGVGNSRLHFGDVGLGANETLVIDHTNNGTLRLRIRNSSGNYRSVMDKRIYYSSHDLYVKPGSAGIMVSAQRSVRLTVTCAGRFA